MTNSESKLDAQLREASRTLHTHVAGKDIPQLKPTRRGRWRVAAATAATAVILIGVPAMVLNHGRDPAPPSSVSHPQPPPTGVGQTETSLDLPTRVDVELLAVRSNQLSGLAVFDLNAATARFISRDELRLSEDPIDGASFTPDGRILVWQGLNIVAFDHRTGEVVMVHSTQPVETLPEALPEVTIAPLFGSTAFWVIQNAAHPGASGRADLVDLHTSAVLSSTPLPYGAQWSVATSQGLIFNRHAQPAIPEDGGQVLHLTPAGQLLELSRGQAVGGFDKWVAVEDCHGHSLRTSCDLNILDIDSGEARTIQRPVEGAWRQVALGFAMEAPRRGIASPRLLISLVSEEEGGAVVSHLLQIPLDNTEQPNVSHTTSGHLPRATWDRNGTRILLIGEPGGLTVESIEIVEPGQTSVRTMPGVLPPGYAVVDAR